MRTKDLDEFSKEAFGIDIINTPEDELPDSKEELELHMQLNIQASC